jgi:hypothetical protein
MRRGDIVWQRRLPGGDCLIVEVWDNLKEYKKFLPREQWLEEQAVGTIWTKHDFPVLRVLHPSEGLIEDPSYYYESHEYSMIPK